MYGHVLHVDAVDEHLALLHVIVTGYEVDERRLAAAALPNDGYGLAFLYGEVDVAQHPLFSVAERYVAELYRVVEPAYVDGVWAFLDVVLGLQNLVNALHRGQSLGDVVAGLGELLERVDYAVQNNHVVNERGTAEPLAVEHEHSTEPHHDDNHQRAEKLAHGMGHLLACVDTEDVVTVL